MWIFDTCQATYTWLYRLEKVCEKLRSKKHLLCEQGIQELKATKIKEKNSLKVELLTTQVVYLLPLANSFNFNPSFLILPDVIFNNTSIPFL